MYDLVRVAITDDWALDVQISLGLVGLITIVAFALWKFLNRRKHFKMVELDISLGRIGNVKLKPNYMDVQIAHRIWTELVTRKAAIKIDPENDVISEIYDSWYTLFTRVRYLISEIPAELIREEESTRDLVIIATQSLNEGLRPHLTKWQARFRNWYKNQEGLLKENAPQDVQRMFPDYAELLEDMGKVNDQLISYANELKKITDGHT
jgi:hypothetical protein